MIQRKGVLFNLGAKEKEINNLKQLVVYRHHWTLKQLDHFYGGTKKAFQSTPMRYSHMHVMVHVAERRYTFKKNITDMFFNLSNYPMCLIRKDAASSRKERDSDEKALNYENFKSNAESEKRIRKGKRLVILLSVIIGIWKIKYKNWSPKSLD